MCALSSKMSSRNPVKCLVCDSKTLIYCENVLNLRSRHTDTPIIEYLKKFADHSLSTTWNRSLKSDKTIICQHCMIIINEYDLARMTAKEMENQLKDLLKRKQELNESDDEYREDADVLKGIEVIVMRCNVCKIDFKSYNELTRHNHVPKKVKGLVIKKICKNGQTKILESFRDISSSSSTRKISVNPTKMPVKSKKKIRNTCCKQCGSLFITKDELKEHIKEVHNADDGNRCNICRGLYPDKEVLQNHIMLHEGKNRLQCVECNTVFTRSNGLMRHMSIHTGEKFHICDTCGKEFIYQSSFRRHLLVHSKVRKYCCVVCGKSFVQTTHLKVHMRSHSKEKPYNCPCCEKTFTYRYTMLAHYKSHSGIAIDDVLIKKTHSCSLCHLSFTQRRKLDDHYVSAHDAIIDGARSSVKDSTAFDDISCYS